MSRVQLALNVPDIDEAVVFYSKLFATAPNKRRPGYANFAIADPPLKLVVFEHQQRLSDAGVDSVEESGTCCFAKQDKVWVDGPDGAWEIYTVLEDSESFGTSSAHATDLDENDSTA